MRAAIVGCGAPRRDGDEGFAIGRSHARAQRAAGLELVCAADVDQGNLERFGADFGVRRLYSDYGAMLEAERPDIVSICTPVGLHADIAVRAAGTGVRGILCEKPFTLGMADADRVLAACREHGVQIALNTQRRFGEPWITAKRLLAEGAIGPLLCFEGVCNGWDLMEWGTHWVDMCRFFHDGAPAEWVLAQADLTQAKRRYGHLVETDAVVSVGFAGGGRGLFFMGDHAPAGTYNRLLGADGVIEIGRDRPIRYIGRGTTGWVEPDVPVVDEWAASVRSLARAVETGIEAPHGAANARAVHEIIMAAYDSAARGALVHLPLAARDFPPARDPRAPL